MKTELWKNNSGERPFFLKVIIEEKLDGIPSLFFSYGDKNSKY